MPATDQLPLPLTAPPATGDTPLVPARMLNEWIYCPRLAWLMWVDAAWADSADTEAGRHAHRRVDAKADALPAPDALDEVTAKLRSITLASERLGLVAKCDLLDVADGAVIPVDTKVGARPHLAQGAYAPERVQLCAQALLLEEEGFTVPEAALWYAGSRERVRIELDDALRAATVEAIGELRLAAMGTKAPPPLADSPKCPRCALAGICLPDEVGFFRTRHPPRPLNPADDRRLPAYVQAMGAKVRKKGERLVVETDDGEVGTAFGEVSQLVVVGATGMTTPALHECLRRDIPVTWMSTGGWVLGHTVGTGHKTVDTRLAQYAACTDPVRALAFARGLVAAKIKNQRTFLRRNWREDRDRSDRDATLDRLRHLARKAETVGDVDALLGTEGEAAALYFAAFDRLLNPEALPAFAFEKRNRRPPADPINALLSFAYAMLTRTWLATLSAVGFDAYLGAFHKPRHGRPALALDMMEPYRPLVADSTVVQVVNNGEIDARGFVTGHATAALKPPARKAFIQAFERRLEQETTHPVFGYRVAMRRLFEVQARLLDRHWRGELDPYPHYLPR